MHQIGITARIVVSVVTSLLLANCGFKSSISQISHSSQSVFKTQSTSAGMRANRDSLDRYVNAAGFHFSQAESIATSQALFNGSALQTYQPTQLDIFGGWKASFSQSHPIYRCMTSSVNGDSSSQSSFDSADGGCEGTGFQNTEVLIYLSDVQTARAPIPLYRCVAANGDHLTTPDQQECISYGYNIEMILGYGYEGSIDSTNITQIPSQSIPAAVSVVVAPTLDSSAVAGTVASAPAPAVDPVATAPAPAPVAVAPVAVAPVVRSTATVYRFVGSAGFHKYALQTGAFPNATLEGPAFSVYTQAYDGTVGLYRCQQGSQHFLSTDSGCEGSTLVDQLGWVDLAQSATNSPLYRFDSNGDWLETLSADEGVNAGYDDQTIIGYAPN